MISKNQIKYVRSLHQKKYRQQYQQSIVENVKILSEIILTAPESIVHIYALEAWIDENYDLVRAIPHSSIKEKDLKTISTLKTPNVLVAIFKIPVTNPSFDTSKNYTLVLDRIQDPGNMGTILRIADWFGIENVICSEGCAEMYNPKVVQATMGAFLRVNTPIMNLINLFENNPDIPVYGTLLDGENVFQADCSKKGFILIGNEGQGISPSLFSYISNKITIPKYGNGESLNASVATGIICASMIGK